MSIAPPPFGECLSHQDQAIPTHYITDSSNREGYFVFRKELPMIEFDECEMSESDFTDEELRLIAKFLGEKFKDKLLIHKEKDG